jgi:hypothetical protein
MYSKCVGSEFVLPMGYKWLMGRALFPSGHFPAEARASRAVHGPSPSKKAGSGAARTPDNTGTASIGPLGNAVQMIAVVRRACRPAICGGVGRSMASVGGVPRPYFGGCSSPFNHPTTCSVSRGSGPSQSMH